MSEHTPGPWTATKMMGNQDGRANVAMLGSYRIVCEAEIGTLAEDGDANLIAAAPDLLNALEAILAAEIIYTGAIEETMEACGIDGVAPLAKQARAAINKARGVSNAAAMKREASK